MTLDIDSSIFEQYSEQKQGSCMAYTGKIGYHPQLGFRADTGEWVYGKLQRGSAYTARKDQRLLEKCLERLPKSVKRVKTRSDSGWYQHPYLEACERCTTHEVTSKKRQGGSVSKKCVSDSLFANVENFRVKKV